MLNLDKCALMHIQSFVRRVEAEARFTGHGRARAITCIRNISKYASFLLIKVRVIGYIIRNCKGSTFICVHSKYQQNMLIKKREKKAVSVLSRSASEKL